MGAPLVWECRGQPRVPSEAPYVYIYIYIYIYIHMYDTYIYTHNSILSKNADTSKKQIIQ